MKKLSKTAVQIILAWYKDGCEMPLRNTFRRMDAVTAAMNELKALGYALIDPFSRVWQPTSTLGAIWKKLCGLEPQLKAGDILVANYDNESYYTYTVKEVKRGKAFLNMPTFGAFHLEIAEDGEVKPVKESARKFHIETPELKAKAEAFSEKCLAELDRQIQANRGK